MSIVPPTRVDWAFGNYIQSDILSPVSVGNLTKKLPFREFTPSTMEKVLHSDRLYFGKGHDFASRVDQLAQQIRFSRTFDATSDALSWALSLLMGDVTTTGPSGSYYTHEIVWQDAGVQKEALYTSLIEKMGSEYQKLISGAFVESVAITAEQRENIQAAVALMARAQTDDATVLPDVTKSVVFRTNHASFTFGATGAEVAHAEDVVRWSLTLGQNPDVRWVPGQTSGEEKLMRYGLIGPQTVAGSITFFMDNTLRNHFLNHDRVGITITNKGVFDVNHLFTIELPVIRISGEGIAQGGQTTELTLEFNEDSIIKDDSVAGSPIRITLVNEIATLLNT